jgi:hypothetical protein
MLLLTKSYFISILLIYILECIFITFIYNIVSFLNILFGNNTLFTNKSKNILVITDIVFSVFLGPDECLQAFECLVTVLSVISEYRHSSQHQASNLHLTANKSFD